MTELTKRVIFAVPAAILFLALIVAGGWFFRGMVLLLALLVQHEVILIGDKAGLAPNPFFIYLFTCWILAYPYLPAATLWGIGLMLVFILVEIFNPKEKAAFGFSSTPFLGIYPALGIASLAWVRDWGSDTVGLSLLLLLVFGVWGNDVFAYFGGRQWGKHPMAPHISPKKTWEGFVSGILGTAVGMGLIYGLVPGTAAIPIMPLLPLVAIISVFGPVGDFTESKLKRAAGVKDSSTFLPGHGGFYDRFDAMMLAAPAVYVYLELISWLGYGGF